MLTPTSEQSAMISTKNKTYDLVLVPRRAADKSPIHLLPGEYLFGSDPECEVILNSPGIAEKHCHVYASPNQVVIKAIDRHTWINEGPFNESNLRSGDCLTIGPIEYKVEQYSQEIHGTVEEKIEPKSSEPQTEATSDSIKSDETSALKEAINDSVLNGKLPGSAMELVDTAANQKAMDHALEEGVDPKFFRERLKKAIETTHLELQNHLKKLGTLVSEENLTNEEKEVTQAAQAAVDVDSQELIAQVESVEELDSDSEDSQFNAISIGDGNPISLSQSDWSENDPSIPDENEIHLAELNLDEASSEKLEQKEQELERAEQKLNARILDVDARWQTLVDREEKLQSIQNKHEEQVADFQKELSDWKAEKESASRSTDEKLVVLQSELSSLRKENASLQQNISELAVLKSENQISRTRESELLNRITQLETDESDLKGQIAGFGNFQNDASDQTNQLQSEIDALRSESESARQESSSLRNEIRNLEFANNELKAVRAENEELKHQKELLSGELQKLEASHEKVESLISHETELTERIQELEGNDSSLREELEQAKSALSKRDSANQNTVNEKLTQIESLRSEIETANGLRAELEDKLQELAGQYNQLKDDYQIKTEQLNNQDGRLEQKISELDGARAELDNEAVSIRTELDEERKVLQTGRDELDQRVVDIEKLEESLKQKADELELKEAEFKNISKLRTELNESRQQWDDEKIAFEQDKQKFEDQKAEWESIRAEIETDRNEFQSLKESVDSDREDIDSRKQEIKNEHQSLLARISDFEEQAAKWNDKEAGWNTKENELSKLQSQLESESTTQKSQIEDLENQILEMKSQEEEINTLKAKAQSEVDSHVETIKHLEEELATLKERTVAFDSREAEWKSREEELLALQNEPNENLVDESAVKGLQEREDALVQKESLLETKEKSLMERDAELNQTEREIQDLKSELAIWKDEIAQREEDLENRNAEIEKQNQQLAEERLKWKVRRDQDEGLEGPRHIADASIDNSIADNEDDNGTDNVHLENEHSEDKKEDTLPTGSLLSSFLSADEDDKQVEPTASVIENKDDSPAKDEDTGELRNQLADLFGISEKAKLENEASQETIEEQTPDNSITSLLQNEDVPNENKNVISDLNSSDDSEDENDNEENSNDDQDTPSAGAGESEDSDSVASYMQQLLARSRGWQEPEEESGKKKDEPNKAVKAPEPKPANKPLEQSDNSVIKSEAEVSDIEPAQISNEPRVRQNRDQVRENINSLREIANLSARSAVAKHSWKQMKTKVAFNSFLAVIAFTFATVCLMSPLIWPGKNFLLYGILSILIGCVSCFELYRTNAQIQRQKNSGNSGQNDSDEEATASNGDAIPLTN